MQILLHYLVKADCHECSKQNVEWKGGGSIEALGKQCQRWNTQTLCQAMQCWCTYFPAGHAFPQQWKTALQPCPSKEQQSEEMVVTSSLILPSQLYPRCACYGVIDDCSYQGYIYTYTRYQVYVSILTCMYFVHVHTWDLASSPGPSQSLSRSHGDKWGEGLRLKLRSGPEMVDSVTNHESTLRTNQVHHFRSAT